MTNSFPFCPDIYNLIGSFLPAKDLLNVAATSKTNLKLFSSPILWQTLTQRDFYQNAVGNNPKNFYKNLTLALGKERKRFISYLIAFEIIADDIKLKKVNGEFQDENKSLYENAAFKENLKLLDDHRQRVVANAKIRQLHIQIENPDTFPDYYIQLIQSISKSELENKIKKAHVYFDSLLPFKYKPNFETLLMLFTDKNGNSIYGPIKSGIELALDDLLAEDNEWQNSTYWEDLEKLSEIEQNKRIFKAAELIASYCLRIFHILCLIDAPITMRIFLNNINLEDYSFLLMNAVEYPSLEVIKNVLEFKLDINHLFFEHPIVGHDIITPLVNALRIEPYRKPEISKQIIALLIKKGADPNTLVSIDSSGSGSSGSDDESNTISIYQHCKDLLANLDDYLYDENEKIIFTEKLKMIIDNNLEHETYLGKRYG